LAVLEWKVVFEPVTPVPFAPIEIGSAIELTIPTIPPVILLATLAIVL
jgi:hypothetical protein